MAGGPPLPGYLSERYGTQVRTARVLLVPLSIERGTKFRSTAVLNFTLINIRTFSVGRQVIVSVVPR